jgi:hypothetical protein
VTAVRTDDDSFLFGALLGFLFGFLFGAPRDRSSGSERALSGPRTDGHRGSP